MSLQLEDCHSFVQQMLSPFYVPATQPHTSVIPSRCLKLMKEPLLLHSHWMAILPLAEEMGGWLSSKVAPFLFRQL